MQVSIDIFEKRFDVEFKVEIFDRARARAEAKAEREHWRNVFIPVVGSMLGAISQNPSIVTSLFGLGGSRPEEDCGCDDAPAPPRRSKADIRANWEVETGHCVPLHFSDARQLRTYVWTDQNILHRFTIKRGPTGEPEFEAREVVPYEAYMDLFRHQFTMGPLEADMTRSRLIELFEMTDALYAGSADGDAWEAMQRANIDYQDKIYKESRPEEKSEAE